VTTDKELERRVEGIVATAPLHALQTS
jgi:hypothetical protein